MFYTDEKWLGKKLIKKFIKLFLLLIIINTSIAFAEGDKPEAKVNILNLQQCIDIAIENNPTIQSSLFNTKIFQSKIGQAKSAYFPQINADTSYNRTNSSITNKALDFSRNDFSAGISMNQLIYDFGKTPASVDVNKLNHQATVEDLRNKMREITFDVKQYYYLVLLNKSSIEVFKESIKLYEQQLKQVNGLYKNGFKSKIDVITAEVNLNNAKLDLIRAQNELEKTFATLNNAMGVSNNISEYIIEGKLEYRDYSIDLDEVVNEAYQLRPDLKSINLSRDSAKKSKIYAQREYFPTLSGNSSFGARGAFPIDPSWSVGGIITIPVFNGLLTHNKVNEAKATVMKRESESETLKQNIYLEIKKIYLNFKETKEKIPLTELIVKQAEERLKLAQKRYEIGVGNIIELKDAEIQLINSKLSYLDTLYQYNLTIFNLEKSIGKDIPDLNTIF